ncbi:hypothetical protein ACP275_08G202200 [Erythranthe tilingii]
MADAALSFALGSLHDVLISKAEYLRGVKGRVQFLKEELKRMKFFLIDASDKEVTDERMRYWISEIRDVAQDSEDAIDMFVLNIDIPGRRGLLRKSALFLLTAFKRYKVGKEIDLIQTRLENIKKSREAYGIQNLGDREASFSTSQPSVAEWERRLACWEQNKYVVGLDADTEKLLEEFVMEESTQELSIATIVGMGGIGKSYLARQVYNHTAVAKCFDCRLWVCVSSQFNPKDVIKELIMQLVGTNSDLLDELDKETLSQVKHKLHQCLEGKRYFIVLDDVWENQHWKYLANAFPREGKASRLLLTSRNQVATMNKPYIHTMRFLDEEKSWDLLLKEACVEKFEGGCPQDFEIIGRAIVRKCGGLPLAICIVGGLLIDTNPSTEKWKKVLNEINYHLGGTLFAILELSYRHLSPQLKSCFLCLGFFKEDATIRVKRLIGLWVALGLVPLERGEKSMEEIGKNLLDELISRNIIQVKDMTTSNARIKNCIVHDLIRELSIVKAREEIGFQILRKERNFQSLDKPRHCAVCYSEFRTDEFMYSGKQTEHIRSLFFHSSTGIVDENPSWWKSFGLLKILDFEDMKWEDGDFPDFSGLAGLKYLSLRNTCAWRINSHKKRRPGGKNLEVLDLAKNGYIDLPNSIWKMEKLRHIYVDLGSMVPMKTGAMMNLETLSSVIIKDGVAEILGEMTKLEKLGAVIDEKVDREKFLTSLAKMEKLACLTLRVSGYLDMDILGKLQSLTKLEIQGGVVRIPDANCFLPNLSSLKLMFTNTIGSDLSKLGKLPHLAYLYIFMCYTEEQLLISAGGFPKLKILHLSDLMMLDNIKVGENAMPELQKLKIDNCMNLKISGIPDELRSITEFVSEEGDKEVQPHGTSISEAELATEEPELEKVATEEPAIEKTVTEEVSEPVVEKLEETTLEVLLRSRSFDQLFIAFDYVVLFLLKFKSYNEKSHDLKPSFCLL